MWNWTLWFEILTAILAAWAIITLAGRAVR